MKVRAICFVVVLICLTTGLAVAGDCKPIRVQVGAAVYLPPCEYLGADYEYCIETPVVGTLNGVWRFYGPAGNWVDVPAPMPRYSGLAGGWGLDVFVTTEGELYSQNAYVWHYDTWSVAQDFVYSSTSYITGGTGKFEGVTGWLGFVGTEGAGGIMFGQYCKP